MNKAVRKWVVCLIGCAAGAHAGDSAWSGDAAGNWTDAAKWNAGVPGGSGTTASADVATFDASNTAPRTVTVDARRNIGGLVFSGTGTNLTLSGGSLWLSNGGTITFNRQVNDTQDTISSPVVLLGDGGTATFTANNAKWVTVAFNTGGIVGTSTVGNVTTLVLSGSSVSATSARSQNGIGATIGDGSAGGKLALVKDGPGVWTLTGNNTFSGGAWVNQGTLRFFGSGSTKFFGTGTLTLADGAALSHANVTAVSPLNDIVVNGNVALSGSDNVTFTGPIRLGAATRQLTVNALYTLAGVVSGDPGAGLVKAGAGALGLLGANTYDGGTILAAGALRVTNLVNSVGTGPLVFTGGTLQYAGVGETCCAPLVTTSAAAVVWDVVNAPATLTLTNDLAVADAFTKWGLGALTLSGSSRIDGNVKQYAGAWNLSGSHRWVGARVDIYSNSVLNLNGDLTVPNCWLGSGTGTGVLNQTSGDAVFRQNLYIGNGSSVNGAGVYNLSGGSVTVTNGLVLGVNTRTRTSFNQSGGILRALGGLQIGRTGTGTDYHSTTNAFVQSGGSADVSSLYLGGNNAPNTNQVCSLILSNGLFTAATFLTLAPKPNQEARIYLGSGAQAVLPDFPNTRGSGTYTEITFDGGALSPAAASTAFISGLTVAQLTAAGAVFDTGYDITLPQVLSDAAGQSGRLTKRGAATLTLTGTNTYSGGTAVSGGTLRLGASGTLPAAGGVTLSGGTLDTGSYTNQTASLLVTANSVLIPGSGQHTFTSQSGAEWSGSLAITGTLDRNRLRFDPVRLTNAQRARITCNGKPVYFTADGFLTDIAPGLTLMVK